MKKLEKMLFKGIYENDLRKVALALNLGADVNAKGEWGQSPLHYAAYRNNVTLAKLLISVGADVNAEDNFSRSPLDFTHSEEMQALLKKHGATL